MQTSINLSLVFWSLGGVAVGMLLGYALSRLLSRNQQIAEVAEVKSANALLEQRLVSQQEQFDAQLKVLQEAKVTLGAGI